MFEEFFSTMQGKSLIVIFIGFAFLFFVFFFKKEENIFSTRALTFSAIFLAVAIAANQVTVFSMPQGGSITLFSMFFVVYIGYMFGLRVGLVAGITFGLLNLLIKPYAYFPAQVILDYVLAFGALGLGGLFVNRENSLPLAYLISVFGRFVFSVFSGYFFFGMYAPEGWNPMIYSLWYNFSYIGVEAIITLIVIFIPSIRNFLEKTKKSNYVTR